MGDQGTVINVRSEGWHVWSNLADQLAQPDEEVHVGSDRKVSEYTLHHSLLCIWQKKGGQHGHNVMSDGCIFVLSMLTACKAAASVDDRTK